MVKEHGSQAEGQWLIPPAFGVVFFSFLAQVSQAKIQWCNP